MRLQRSQPRHPQEPTMPVALAAWLPKGAGLSPEAWRQRHRFLVGVLWAHVPLLGLLGLITHPVLHLTLEIGLIAAFAALASRRDLGRSLRSTFTAFGLLTCSAVLVHLTGGRTEMHFHFFVVLVLIALYQDWRPLLLALGYVVVHHGAMSVIDPHAIYSDARDVRAGLSQMVVTTPRTRVGDEVATAHRVADASPGPARPARAPARPAPAPAGRWQGWPGSGLRPGGRPGPAAGASPAPARPAAAPARTSPARSCRSPGCSGWWPRRDGRPGAAAGASPGPARSAPAPGRASRAQSGRWPGC